VLKHVLMENTFVGQFSVSIDRTTSFCQVPASFKFFRSPLFEKSFNFKFCMNHNKHWFLRLIALSGALFMLVVSTGISISIHYCNGRIIDFAVDKRAEACDGYYELTTTSPIGCSFARKGCCEDQDWLLVVENEVPPSDMPDLQVHAPFVATLTAPKVQWRSFRFDDALGLANAPPELQQDHQVLYQVFLI
jgi:hypothetical protein